MGKTKKEIRTFIRLDEMAVTSNKLI